MKSYFSLLLLVTIGSVSSENEMMPPTTTIVPPHGQIVYNPPEQNGGYHSPYPYGEAYGGPSYEGFFYPQVVPPKPPVYQPDSSYLSAIKPPFQVESLPETVNLILAIMGAVQFVLRVLAKFGLFVIGGVALLIVGGIFTTAVCSLTPICVISFPGFTTIDKESMRSLMTPDKISAAAALVQDAIGKYKRLQRIQI